MTNGEDLWEEDVLTSQRAHRLNGLSYSNSLLREAKKILEKQRKERAALIRELERRRQKSQG